MPFAKNMYIDWTLLPTASYTMVIKSWYCSQNADDTFWSVHNWSNGYAGFQYNVYEDNVAKREIILGIWDDGSNITTVEYMSNLANEEDINFIEYGTGKHIITNINWQNSTWYSMAVGVKYDSNSNFSYYAHWVTLEGANNWRLYAVIGLPGGNRTLNKSSVFQEDFEANDLPRECKISNAYGRLSGSSNWQLWSQGTIRSYDPNDGSWDEEAKCWCDFGTYTNGKYILLRSGGDSGPCMYPLAYNFNLEISSSFPPSYPKFPHYIKNCDNNKYIKPFDNNTVVQSSTRTWWEILESNDGYVYIVTPDKSKAITVNGTSDGTNLTLTSFTTGNDTQKWLYIEDISSSETCYYLCPKNALLKGMYVQNSSENSCIKIATRNTTLQKFKWIIF